MTYCVGIRLDEGLVFCSDSRTNAGADRVSAYSKMHRFHLGDHSELVLLTAGNLATCQAVIAQIERDLLEDADVNIAKVAYVSDAAEYIGELALREQSKYATAGPGAGFNAEATIIIGGRLCGESVGLYMIYPEGNHIAVSEQFPYLQVGETKYGKPILDRIIRPDTPHEIAMRCALVSMDSTMRSNATVGPPIELLFYRTDNLDETVQYYKFEENDPYLVALRKRWDQNIRKAFNDLPPLNRASAVD